MGLSVRGKKVKAQRIRFGRGLWASLFLVVLFLVPRLSGAQEVITDQVSLLSAQGEIFGITQGEGIARVVLAAGEDIHAMESKGVTGFVLTSQRLLGFSRRLQRWIEVNLSSAEHVINWTVTARMIVVRGKKGIYGFQSDAGRWKHEVWGAGEVFQEGQAAAHIGVWITDRRALGFSAFTGGFFSRDLPSGGRVKTIRVNDNVVILQLEGRNLVFRSGLAIWRELP